MKLVWHPEKASAAYIDTVRSCGGLNRESSAAEMISAMAGGWNAKLIVEACFSGGATTKSVGLAIAARHSGGRHVCIVKDEKSKLDYVTAMEEYSGVSLPEVLVGEAAEVIETLAGVDFLVVDARCKYYTRVFRVAKLSHRGAVLVCKNATQLGIINRTQWGKVLDNTVRVVRSVILPVGNGLDIAYVSCNGGELDGQHSGRHWWISHVDRRSGEEHLFRR
ncbi:uncharacterized protein LOC111398489 isoform X1 [Olea europaea var. sylvestris]|uniref:S-adenosyl-L-methionine-dependent methyltransferase n=1 Tax=Olea europaea subsp. europaea TaxID=158383 RepID=A0A8S0UKW6_OLEEU|nr:uncharacterized protein LOC111398489 isoform X1 [Olea europaea var. sylvestris]CAA3018869.1 Hypothetical predicted protein [Olea europaea subsp. europaea]